MTRLNKLKISARISKEAPSDVNQGILLALLNSTLALANPGPWKVFLPRLPWCPGAGTGKADAGNAPVMKSERLADFLLPKEGVSGVS